MNKMEELLKNVNVEWKRLGEIGSFYGGLQGKSKYDFNEGNAKFVPYKNVYLNPSLNLSLLESVKIYDGEKQRTLERGDVIFTLSSETLEECGLSSVVTEQTTQNIYLNSFCFYLRLHNTHILLPDFSKYLFRSKNLRKQIIKTAQGVTRFNVSKKLMKNIIIPIPPLEVQKEIVGILDMFSTLTVELARSISKEITLRQKQYEYYREKLLMFDKSHS